MKTKLLRNLILALCLIVFPFIIPAFAQTTFTSTNAGARNWSVAASWTQPGVLDADGVPDGDDNVIILNAHSVNVNGISACLAMTINGSGTVNFSTNGPLAVGGVLTMNGTSQITGTATQTLNATSTFSVPVGASATITGIALNVTGASTIAGTLVLNTDAGVKTFMGAVTNTGSWTSTSVTTPNNLVFQNGVSSSGTLFTAGSASFNTTAAQAIGGTTAMSFANIVTVGAGVTLTNSNTNIVTMSNAGVALTGNIFTQGTTGNTLSYGGSSIGVTTFNATGNNNTVIYTANAPTIFSTNYFNLTHSGTGTVTVAGISIAGNLTESSTGTFNLTGTTTFNGAATQTISGAGTFTFASVTLAASGATHVNVNKSISISGTLNFTAANARLLVVNATSDVTLGSAANISNFDTDSYIQLDGTTGTNSNLKKTSDGTTGSWQITYPIGTSTGGYTPLVLTAVAGVAPTAAATISVKAIYNNSNQGQLRRTFRTVVAGNAVATTFTSASFSYSSTLDLSTGDAIANYNTLYSLVSSTGGTWTTPTGTAPGAGAFIITTATPLSDGINYYTIGQLGAYPNVWYSYQTGVWSNWQNWTSDPSGSSLVNGLNLPPQPGDEIAILNGITITNDVNGRIASATTINAGGTLDMSTTTGNTLGTVIGTGTLRINGVTLPTGIYASFVSTLGGTIEYYNTGGNLSITETTYNKLKLTNSTGANIVFVMASNLIVNNTFDITTTGAGTATWQINDASAIPRTITLNGDLTVGTGGRITAGTGGAGASANQHSLTLFGNFTNNGIVRFFDPTQAPFTSPNTSIIVWTAALQGNAVNVTFKGGNDAAVTCNNTTDFYRFILDKGTGQQAILTVNSSNTSNFRFFGPSDLGANTTGSTWEFTSNDALSIVNGTLQLTGSINIPVLEVSDNFTAPQNGTGYFPIPRNGALWLNGANVTVQLTDNSNPAGNSKDGRILMSGLLRITAGTINNGFGKGLGSQDGGTYFQEGGTVNCWQFRPKNSGAFIFSFIQTGGTLNVGYGFELSGGLIDVNEKAFCRFDLYNASSTFQMSGNAILNIAKPTALGLFNVTSSSANYNVTGGTVNLYMGLEEPTIANPGNITSTAGLYNVNIYQESPAGQTAQLKTNDLVVLNNLTINTGGALGGPLTQLTSILTGMVPGIYSSVSATSGGSGTGAKFYVEVVNPTTITVALNPGSSGYVAGDIFTFAGSKFGGAGTSTFSITTANVAAAPSLVTNNLNVTIGGNFTLNTLATYTPGTGTTTFNGTGAQTWTHSGIITALSNVVMSKTAGTTLTLAGSSIFPSITGALTLTSGTLADGAKTITVSGTGVLTNNAIHSGAGVLDYTSTATTINGNGGTFGNLNISTNATIATAGTQTVTGTLRLIGANSTLNIGSNSLSVLGNIYSNAGTAGLITDFTATKRILTSGLHNAGGLTRQGAIGDLLFPVGSSLVGANAAVGYTPIIVNVTVTGAHGTLTVRPVNSEHPNVTTLNQSLRYYWRVTSSGYSGISTVTHKSYTFSNSGLLLGTTASYSPARYDRSLNTWGYRTLTYNAAASTAIPNFNTGASWTNVVGDQLDGEYTCGYANTASPPIAFGTFSSYYSKGTGAWNAATGVWTASSTHAGADLAGPPCANCPVEIGNGSGINHTITIDASSRSCGTLTISSGSTLDCGSFTSLNFGTNTGGAVSGTGTIRISQANFPAGDFTNFLGTSGGTVEWYSVTGGLTGVLTPTAPNPAGMTAGTYTNISASTGGASAKFTVVVTSNSVTSLTITSSGSGYVAAGTITFNGSIFQGTFNGGGAGAGTGSKSFTINAANILTAYTIPTAGPTPQFLSLPTYYNLVINPVAGFTITLPPSNLTIYNDLTQGSNASAGTVVTNGARTISVTRDLTVSSGIFNFSSAAGAVTTLGVTRNIVNNGTFSAATSTGNNVTHTISTTGSITNNGTMNLRDITSSNNVVDITFTGSSNSNVNFDGSGVGGTTLDFVTINKGTSQTPTVTFSVGGTVTAANSNIALGWLRLTNGTFIFANTGTYSLITLNGGTVADAYTIPATAKLKVNSGIVNIITTASTFGQLLLNGSLEVAGGTVNVGAGTSGNDLEYASAGTPTIIVSSGALNVNGAIRRSSSTITGALVYNQTGGLVTVGGNAADNTRGVFEIDYNTGSSFTLTGTSSLTVQRQTGGTGYADIFINPVSSNVSSTSTIVAGLGSVNTNTGFRINIAPSIGNFSVAGGANAQTVRMYSNPMILGGTLTIASPSSLNTNPIAAPTGLDVFIAGDLTMNGTASYLGGANTTTFNGTGTQAATLTATPTIFNNMTVNKTVGTTVTLSGTAPSLTNLNILSGILNVGSLTLTVSGNITNNSSQVGTGSIAFSGAATTHTINSSGGSFVNLSLGVTGAPATPKIISVNGNMTINGVLDFTTFGGNRYLFMGSNLLSLGSTASISNASATRFIRTNGVSSDLGVLKNWPVGTNSFIYPVGTRTNYTPVAINNLVVSTAGSYTVLPVDSQHPTASPGTDPILSYYWSIKKSSTLAHGATGTLVFTTPTGLIAGSTGPLLKGYYLDLAGNPLGWVSPGPPNPLATPPNTIFTINNSLNTVLPAVNGQFDYTYGTDLTLTNPVNPVYSRFADADGISNPTTVSNLGVGGSWAIGTSWTTSPTGNGGALGAAPTNRPVVILPAARINLDILGQSAFSTQLSGLLVVSTVGHSIGSITSTGTMRTTTNTLPAGNYTTYTAAGGGTIEYAAAIPMNSRSTYNNLLISSTVAMTVSNLVVNGNLTIGGGNTLDNSLNNANISLAGNWSNGGTFTAGLGTVTLNGTAAQGITGVTTFKNLAFNNTFGTSPQITINNAVTTEGTLTMTSGIINLAGTTFTLGTSGVASTLVRTASATTNWMYGGSFRRNWLASTAISSTAGNLYGLFPVGASTAFSYRPVEINSTVSPTSNGFFTATHTNVAGVTNLSPTYNDGGTSILRTHNAQYTTAISGTIGGTYDIGVTMTGLPTGVLSDIRLAISTGATTASAVGTHVTATGSAQNPTAKRSGISTLTDFNNSFRIGTTNIIATPLPIDLLYFNATLLGNEVKAEWATAQELNNDFFTLEKSSNPELGFQQVARLDGHGNSNVKQEYYLVDKHPYTGLSYYRLKQTDFDGGITYSKLVAVNYEGSSLASLRVYPNPLKNKQTITIEITGLKGMDEVPLMIYNFLGQTILNTTIVVDQSGNVHQEFFFENPLLPGVFVVRAASSMELTQRLVVE